MRVLPILMASMLLAGCATVGQDRLAERDPLEGFNRGVWAVNQAVDKVALKPVATVYRTVIPKPARRGLSNVLANLFEPWNFINAMLQGKPDRAFDAVGRFMINTTLGVGGLADPATKLGIKRTQEDFGQTLAVWGVNGGPYLVLPLLGPSTLRDGVGLGVAQFADPYRVCLRECGITNNTGRLAATAFEIVDARTALIDSGADALLASSADSYATARSAYLQRRRALILDRDDGEGTDNGDAELDAAVADMDAQDSGATPPVPSEDAPAVTPPPSPPVPAPAPAAPAVSPQVVAPPPAPGDPASLPSPE